MENGDDLISRQAAINALHMHLMYRMGTDSNKKRLDDWINGVPSAQPDLDITAKIDKAYDDGYEAGYLQGRHDWGDLDE